jgi:outer membrane protein
MNAPKNWVLAILAALFLIPISMSAQTPTKFGHLNSGNLLEMMPEVKIANDSLGLFGKSLSARLDSLTAVFQKKYESYAASAKAGDKTPLVMQSLEAELQKMQADGRDFEQSMQQILGIKRQQLLDPILGKVDIAIKAVGKEGGYLFIFDTSTGSTLYALESEDVMSLVKAKLKI